MWSGCPIGRQHLSRDQLTAWIAASRAMPGIRVWASRIARGSKVARGVAERRGPTEPSCSSVQAWPLQIKRLKPGAWETHWTDMTVPNRSD